MARHGGVGDRFETEDVEGLGDKGSVDGHEDVAEKLASVEDARGLDDVAVDERVVDLDGAGAAVKANPTIRNSSSPRGAEVETHQPTLPKH